MTLRWTLILSATFLFGAFTIGALFTTQACFLAGAGTGYPSLQQAISRAEPGCTIILLGGTYEENVVIDKPLRIIPRAHAKPFALLGQHPTGTSSSAAFIDPASASTLRASNPDQPVIEIRASHVEIQGLHIQGGKIGIWANGVDDLRLLNNTIRQSQQTAVRLDRVQASTLQGNTISRSTAGMEILNSRELTVVSNLLRRNAQGIRLENSNANRLHGNKVSHSESVGLHLKASNRNEVRQNTIAGNAAGVVLEDSSNNALSANRLNRNAAPLRVWGTDISHFVHQISSDNTINGRPVYYLVDAKGTTINGKDNPGYLALVRSRNVTVRGVSLPEGSQGVLVISTQGSTLRNLTIPASERGLYLRDSSDNALLRNRIERTEDSGVTLIRSSGNHLEANTIRANGGHGLRLNRADDNDLIGNEIRDNGQSGVHLSASRGADLEDNRIVGNWVGVYIEGGGEHRFEANTIAKSQFAVFVQGAESNRFQNNRLRENRHVSNQPALLNPQSDHPKDAQSAPSGN